MPKRKKRGNHPLSIEAVTNSVESTIHGDGERFQPGIEGDNAFEHLHRYSFATKFAQGKRILDIACGEGYGSRLLSTVAESVVGVDISDLTLRHAKQNYQADNLEFIQGDCRDLPFADGEFDLVVSFETLEHVVEHRTVLRQFHRVLKDSGILVLSTPDKDFYGASEPANPFHLLELNETELKDLFSEFFPQIQMYQQKVVSASVIIPSHDPPGIDEKTGIFQFASGNANNIEDRVQVDSAPYRVVIASKGTLPSPIDVSLFFGNQIRSTAEIRLDQITSSWSWRLGTAVTWPLRQLIKIADR